MQLDRKHIEQNKTWQYYLTHQVDAVHEPTLNHLRLVALLESKFNFSCLIKVTNQWSALVQQPEDSVTGQLELLESGRALVGITPYRLSLTRVDAADFTATFTWRPWFKFLFRHPKHATSHFQYLVPFQWPVWLALSATILLIICLLIFYKSEQSFRENLHSDCSRFCAVMWTISYVCQQYAYPFPFHNSARITIFSLVILVYLSYTYYCTFIIGSLITESPKTIKTVEDLIQTKMEFGTTFAPYTSYIFLEVMDRKLFQFCNY